MRLLMMILGTRRLTLQMIQTNQGNASSRGKQRSASADQSSNADEGSRADAVDIEMIIRRSVKAFVEMVVGMFEEYTVSIKDHSDSKFEDLSKAIKGMQQEKGTYHTFCYDGFEDCGTRGTGMAESGGKENVNEPPVSCELQQEVTFQSVNDSVMANDEGSLPIEQHSDTTIQEKASQEAGAFASTEDKNTSNVDADCIIAYVCKTVQGGMQTSQEQIGKDINTESGVLGEEFTSAATARSDEEVKSSLIGHKEDSVRDVVPDAASGKNLDTGHPKSGLSENHQSEAIDPVCTATDQKATRSCSGNQIDMDDDFHATIPKKIVNSGDVPGSYGTVTPPTYGTDCNPSVNDGVGLTDADILGEIDPPSFSIGLTQLESEATNKAADVVNDYRGTSLCYTHLHAESRN